MTLYNYFKFELKIKNFKKIDKVFVNLINLELENEDIPTVIQIKNRNTFFKNNELNNIEFYIENNGDTIEDRIDYLLDEEWTFKDINFQIEENFKSLDYEIINYEQISSLEYDDEDDFIKDLLSKKLKQNTICILGPKPNKLYGYNMNQPQYEELKTKIKKVIEQCYNYGQNIVITNGYIGGETIGYDCVMELKTQKNLNITNILAVPFLNLDQKWVQNAKQKYKEMQNNCDYFLEIDKIQHYKFNEPEVYAKEKMIKKNEFDIDLSSTIILIKDKENTLNSVKNFAIWNKCNIFEIDATQSPML